MRTAIRIAKWLSASGLLLALLSLMVVNSILACSVDPAAHHCCRRSAGKIPCEIPHSVTAYPLLKAIVLDQQDFTPAVVPVEFEALPELVAGAVDAPIDISEFDTGPPGPMLRVLRI